MKKGFFVYSEKHERTIISHKSKRTILDPVCETCGKQVKWLTLEETSAASGIETKEICRMIADDCFHFKVAENECLFICASSVFEIGKNEGNLP